MPRLLPTLPPPPAFSWSSPIPTNLFHGFNLRSRSNLSALCFHNLTNPFSRKPFDFTSMQIPRGCAPFSLLSVSASLWRSKFVALCFHILTNCFSRLPAGLLAGKPFVLTTIRIAPGAGGKFENCLRFSLCALCLRGKSILFILLRALCRREKTHLPWNQELPDSFAKTPGVGWSHPFARQDDGFPITYSKRAPNPQVIRPCHALRRGHEPSVKPFQCLNHYLQKATLC
jgi:hypothetical protein